ncbi:MAG: alpha/beta fold hydrolase [Pseudomonas sp.]|uniref:alpha/beta fold hydrolase n=1 Tax=Pseudomonas sp. TaxID=306 RepID=UPI0030F2A4C2
MFSVVREEFQASHWYVATGLAGYCWEPVEPVAMVLLQHGYGEYACRYYHQHSRLIQRLLELNIAVYAFDMHGHGGSTGKPGNTDIRKAVSEHLIARELLAKKRLPLYLIGHSLGGLVTAGSVARDPEGVEGVVLLSPAIVKPATFVSDAILVALSRVLNPFPVAPLNKPEGLSRNPAQVERFLADPHCYVKAVHGLLGLTAVSVSNSCWRAASRWDTSVLLLHGTDDQYTSCQTASALFEKLAVQDKELAVYEGFRHELLNDDADLQVTDKLIGWVLNRLSARLIDNALERTYSTR